MNNFFFKIKLPKSNRSSRHLLCVDQQGVCGRHGQQVCGGCGADFRRQRLQLGVPGGEVDARRQDLPDLRGHVPNPARHHFAPAAPEGQRGRGAGLKRIFLLLKGSFIDWYFVFFLNSIAILSNLLHLISFISDQISFLELFGTKTCFLQVIFFSRPAYTNML